MRIALVGINAKYIHPNLAIRLLMCNTSFPVDLKEYTIKDNIDKIIIELQNYDVIAFSCYIWNIKYIKEISLKLKEKTIIFGGPEVSYNPFSYIPKYASFVIKNEGEEAFDSLLKYLDGKMELLCVPNLYFNHGFTFDKYVDLDKIKLAYDLLDDVSNCIVYVETSRGCPFKCSYCMASLDNKVRYFSLELIKSELLKLIKRGAKTIKFLDRTFNANKKYFLSLIDFLILNHQDNSFQFEITGDLLDRDVIEYINEKAPKNLFRFEIGVQSTNDKTNLLVYRKQNNEKLFSNIKLIQGGERIDLHLDLIAGLPNEDLVSFKKTFNDVLSLRPLELQLGFLKLLHGTTLENESLKYNYVFDDNPPYEIISNSVLSIEDIKEIHIAEDAFDRYYNATYLKKTINLVLDRIDNCFDFFYNLGSISYEANGLDYYFSFFNEYVKSLNLSDYSLILESLIYEYLDYFNLKPKVWWENDRQSFKKKIKELFDKGMFNYNLDQLFRYSVLVELDSSYILAMYLPNNKKITIIKK